MQSGGERLVALEQLPQRDEEKNAQESGAAEAAGDAGLGQGFEVVVVRVIDDFSVVVGLVGGEDGLQGAQAGAGPGMVEENGPGVQSHRGTLAGGHFERLKRGEAIENLFPSEPGDQQESQEQDEAASEDMLPAGAAQQHHQDENADLDAETYNATSGCGQEKGADGQKRENGNEIPALFAN